MKPGKIPDTVRKRTVLKQLKNRHKGVYPALSAEETCYGFCCEGGEILLAEAARYGSQKDVGVYALTAAVNDLAARGAGPAAVYVRIMLTGYACESRLKGMVKEIESAAAFLDVQVMDIAAETVPVIRDSIVYVTAAGVLPGARAEAVPDETQETAAGAGRRAGSQPDALSERDENLRGKPGQELVLTKWAGMEGTLRILEEKRDELSRRFVPAFLNQTAGLRAYLTAVEEARIAMSLHVTAIRQVTEEGIMAALWRMAECSGTGLSVSLKAIPVRQETIEICEFYHVNPYELTSAGCMLMAADDGKELVEKLREQGIPASVIGYLTDGNERIILRGEEVSYLERPQQEALAACFMLWDREEEK